MKTCNICNSQKENELMVKSKGRIYNTCLVCYNERNKRNKANNIEGARASKKRYEAKNKEKIKVRQQRYYEVNKEHIAEVKKKWYINNYTEIKLRRCLK